MRSLSPSRSNLSLATAGYRLLTAEIKVSSFYSLFAGIFKFCFRRNPTKFRGRFLLGKLAENLLVLEVESF